MLFISLDDWLSATGSWRHSRSDALKALDKAIDDANTADAQADAGMLTHWASLDELSDTAKNAIAIEEARRAAAVAVVSTAFTRWVATQTASGKDWRASVRNASGAVKTLYDQLEYWRIKLPKSSVEMTALAELVQARDASIPLLFKGCVCTLKADRGTLEKIKDQKTKMVAVKSAVKIVKNSRKLIGSGASSGGGSGGVAAAAGGIAGAVMKQVEGILPGIIKSAFGVTLEQISWEAGEAFFKETLMEALNAIKEEIAALAPAAGLIVSTGTLMMHSVKLVQTSMATHELLNLSMKLEVGDSQTALKRVRDWQLRDIALRTSKVTRAAANSGAQLATILTGGAAAPAQMIIGICNAVMALVQIIADMGMQYKESRALTKYLNNEAVVPLGRDIFATAPLAAAYYLLNTPTSHIALQLVNIGSIAWQSDVEHLKKDGALAKVITESERLINASRYVVNPAMGARFREREGKETLVKMKEFFGKQPLRGTTTMESAASS
ncbi:MAG: hypothetical protein K2Q97_13785 [Burkholderiaceae bacterium]|nr:hypothetical protein [Burkholderiaceae bacterium]